MNSWNDMIQELMSKSYEEKLDMARGALDGSLHVLKRLYPNEWGKVLFCLFSSAIAADGGSVAIKSNRRAFTLLYTIQEEVHRFAIGYHRERRSKAMLKSRLLQIEGIGAAKAAALLKAFGSIEKISQKSVEEIASVKGVTKANAEKILDFFKNE